MRKKSTEDHTMIYFSVDIVVEPDDDGFHAFCPALKGLHVDGRTEREALKNAVDGGAIYLESLIKHGDPIPVGVVVECKPAAHHGEHDVVHTHRRSLALSFI